MAIVKRGRGRPPSNISPPKGTQRRGRTKLAATAQPRTTKSEDGGDVGIQQDGVDNGCSPGDTIKARPGRGQRRPSAERLPIKPSRTRATRPRAVDQDQDTSQDMDADTMDLEEDHGGKSEEWGSAEVSGIGDERTTLSPPSVITTKTRRQAPDGDGSDATIRRRLGDMTKRCVVLERKYRDLEDLAVREAEANFDKLKQQTNERAKASAQLVASLKEEIASQGLLADEAQKLKAQLKSKDSRVEELEKQISDLTSSLLHAKTEIKNLSTKLSVSRSVELAGVRVPGSAIKSNGPAARATAMVQNELLQQAQLKEDMYADLTGLIIRNVKSGKAETIYDCIQTGRNGTLHFKLAVSNETDGGTYEDIQFTYMPQLDSNRDEELIELLPEYLAEEITFPRPHAAKFYSRVTRALTERLDADT